MHTRITKVLRTQRTWEQGLARQEGIVARRLGWAGRTHFEMGSTLAGTRDLAFVLAALPFVCFWPFDAAFYYICVAGDMLCSLSPPIYTLF